MFKFQKPLPLVATTAAALWLCACVEADKAGPPQLMSFAAVGPDGTAVEPTAMAPVPVISPLSSFTAIFDNVIDYADVQDADAGVGKPGVVLVTAPNSPMVSTIYVPNGHHERHLVFSPGPSISAQVAPGMPSDAAGSVTLDTSKIRGKGGQPLTIAANKTAQWNFVTAPFSVSAAETLMAYPADKPLVIATSNLPAEDFATKVSVTGTLNGMPIADLAVDVEPGEGSPTQFTIAPATGTWPEGATITVTVAGAADAYGVALAAPAVLTFAVAAAAAAAP